VSVQDTDATPAVSLRKVSLTKSAPAVSLTKATGATGTLRVNLNWNTNAAGGEIDLDLGCLYEYADGSKGAVQAVGGLFRDRHQSGPDPICRLDGDDRSGSNSAGENLYIDLRQLANIRRILIFTLIYDGVPNWAAADGMVTLFPVSGPQIEIRLDEPGDDSPICAIALLENTGSTLKIRREVRYVQGSQEVLDRAYGWGLKWVAGSK